MTKKTDVNLQKCVNTWKNVIEEQNNLPAYFLQIICCQDDKFDHILSLNEKDFPRTLQIYNLFNVKYDFCYPGAISKFGIDFGLIRGLTIRPIEGGMFFGRNKHAIDLTALTTLDEVSTSQYNKIEKEIKEYLQQLELQTMNQTNQTLMLIN